MTAIDIRRNAREIFVQSMLERRARLERDPLDPTPAISMAMALEIARTAFYTLNQIGGTTWTA